MASMSAGDVILTREMRADTRRHGFFTHVEMDESRHDSGSVNLLQTQLKLPDPLHGSVKAQYQLVRHFYLFRVVRVLRHWQA
jgi:hypothetical protein